MFGVVRRELAFAAAVAFLAFLGLTYEGWPVFGFLALIVAVICLIGLARANDRMAGLDQAAFVEDEQWRPVWDDWDDPDDRKPRAPV
jgi:hypothetical protein